MKKIVSGVSALLLLFLTSCSEEPISVSGTSSNSSNEVAINTTSRYTDEEATAKVRKIAQDLNADIVYNKSVTADKAIVFNSEQELRGFIVKMQQAALNNNITGEKEFDKAYIAHGMSSGFASLNFQVTTGANGCINSVVGGWSGVTLGLGYTQGGTNISCHSATVCGWVNYNLYFEGIGTVYSQQVCYSIRV